MDLTGRFPHCSSRGNEYILIAYHYDSNTILGIPIKNRQAATISQAWQQLHTKLTTAGIPPNTWILDNEISQDLILSMAKQKTSFQLVPPHTHRANAAERAIQTFKSHFTAGLASVDPEFPVTEWDRLLDQAFITLNLLRTARVNPKLSAHTYLFGNFDFNSTPLAPPGTKVVTHINVDNRPTWGARGKEGWYVGPSLNHYRCVGCFIPTTRAEIDTNTATFIPKHIKFPEVNIVDYLKQTATDIVALLKNPPHPLIPSLQAGNDIHNAIYVLAGLLNNTNNTETHLTNARRQTFGPGQDLSTLVPPLKPLSHSAPLPRVMQPNPFKSPSTFPTQFPPYAFPSPPRVQLHSSFHPPPMQPQNIPPPPMLSNPKLFHIYDNNGNKQSLDALLQGPDKLTWQRSASNEFGRLAQGNHFGTAGTDTIEFIPANQLPSNSKTTYASFVCDIKPFKSETHRVRMVVGGDKLSYDDDAGAPAASLLETKLLVNSVISDASRGAKFMTLDIKDFYLATPMPKPEYMKLSLTSIPPDIITKYNLHSIATPSKKVFVKIKKGMYGLKQAAILAYNHLVANLSNHGYRPIPHTVGLWKHDKRNIIFCLCVDDFGIKYFNADDVHHLLTSLRNYYKISPDWSGSQFCGLQFSWHLNNGYVNVSMPKYIPALLKKLNYEPNLPQYSPHPVAPFTIPSPGKRQFALPPDSSPPLNSKLTTKMQSIIGSLLYYARAIDCTILPALNSLSTQQSKPTEQTLRLCHRLLDYVATYPNPILCYRASDMVLSIHSDAAYLVAPKTRSRIAGFFSLGSNLQPTTSPHCPVLVECKTLRHVVTSSAEAEIAGVYHNAQIAIPIRRLLTFMGHPQPTTSIITDNSTVSGFANDNITQKRSKSWDMRFYWLRDKEQSKDFKISWKQAFDNLADYFTKHFTATYHKTIRSKYVLDPSALQTARVC